MGDISTFNSFSIDELEILEKCLRNGMQIKENNQTDLLRYDLWLRAARTLVNKRSEGLSKILDLATKTCTIMKD